MTAYWAFPAAWTARIWPIWPTSLGLRVLAVHVDSGWNSEIAVRNIEKMCEKLNIQLHTYVMDWPTMKELTRAFMLSVWPIWTCRRIICLRP